MHVIAVAAAVPYARLAMETAMIGVGVLLYRAAWVTWAARVRRVSKVVPLLKALLIG